MPLSAFAVTSDALTPTNATLLTLIIWGVCLGVFAGGVWSVLHRRIAGAPIRMLLALEAFEETTAATLGDLGVTEGSLSHRALQKDRALQSLVTSITDEEGTVRYFIPEERRYRAAIRYEEKRSPVFQLLLTGALSVALGFLLIFLVPIALSMVNSLS